MGWNEPSIPGNGDDAGSQNGRRPLSGNGGPDPRDAKSLEFVRRYQAGDRTAFDPLYKMWRAEVCAYARAVLMDRERAEDVMQDVFESVVRYLDRFEPEGEDGFRRWLFTIARNRTSRVQAEEARLPVSPLVEPLGAAGEDEDGNDPWSLGTAPVRPVHKLRDELAALAVEDAEWALGWISDDELAQLVKCLPEPQRHALALRFTQDLSAAEVAEAMGREPYDVRQLQSRALRRLDEQLGRVGRRRLRGRRREAMLKRIGPLPVLGARRFVLSGPSLAPGISRSAGFSRYPSFASTRRW